MLKSLFLALFFVLIGSHFLAAQTISHNQNGEKIVLYNDGSWRYFDEDDPNDVALLNDANKIKKVKAPKIKRPKVKKPKKDKIAKGRTTKFKKEKKDKIAKAQTPKFKKEKGQKKIGKLPNLKKADRNKSYANTKPNNKGKKGTTPITSGQNYKRIINKEILDIRDKQNMAYEKERIANFATRKYERELAAAKKRKLDKNALKSIEARRKEAKLRLKLARNQNKALLKQRRSYEAILSKEPSTYAKAYNKLANKYNKDFESVPMIEDEQLANTKSTNKPRLGNKPKLGKKAKTPKQPIGDRIAKIKKPKKEASTSRSQVLEERFNDSEGAEPLAYQVAYPSNKPDVHKAAVPACNIVFEGKDSFSGKKRTDLGKSPFFAFTSEKVRTYFEEGDMIECDAYLSAVAGGYKFICIEVTVASETAQRSYGSIEKQGQLSIKLVDGTTVNLYNNKTDYGFLDPLKKEVLYKAQYLIPNEHVKTLSKVDIDMVRLVWSTGYEDYTIYETDFLINQLACLNK